MLPNHAPLIIAEQFGTLETLFPGRIDPCRGRAPGTDGATQQALRRDPRSGLEFPALLDELRYFLSPVRSGQTVRAIPGAGLDIPIWLLGSSDFSARLAAELGLRFSFAGHFSPEGIAATEAANSSVSGANLIPVLSLGIPGNASAVFLILAADSIGTFNPGPSVFRFDADSVNPELVVAFGLFSMMMIANLMNWTIGGVFMRFMGIMARIPKHKLLPIILLLTLTAIYIQETEMSAIWFTVGFGILGYFMRRLAISPLPFVIAFILGGRLEETARGAFSATGGDPWFLFSSFTSIVFLVLSVAVVVVLSMKGKREA